MTKISTPKACFDYLNIRISNLFRISDFVLRISLLLLLFLLPPSVAAAVLSFDPPERMLVPGEEFEVLVRLDTEGETVNALAATIRYPAYRLTLLRAADGNSFVSLWLQRPKDEPAYGLVSFEGVIPGGYRGDGSAIRLAFRVEDSRSTPIAISFAPSSRVLLHNGRGDEASLALRDAKYQVAAGEAPQPLIPEADTDPPEEFAPSVARSPDVFGGNYFLVFAAQDKGSGISHYEVAESARGGLPVGELPWRRAESPYLLTDQTRRSSIFIKAVDLAGNERIVTIPALPEAGYRRPALYAILIIAIPIILYVLLKLLAFLRKKFKMRL